MESFRDSTPKTAQHFYLPQNHTNQSSDKNEGIKKTVLAYFHVSAKSSQSLRNFRSYECYTDFFKKS